MLSPDPNLTFSGICDISYTVQQSFSILFDENNDDEVVFSLTQTA